MFFSFIHKVDCVAADGEGLFGGACGLEGDARRVPLPGGRGAGGIGRSVFCFSRSDARAVEELLQHGLAAADLRDYGVEFLTVFRDAAISGVIAVPTGSRIEHIELGKIEGGDVAGHAVDEKPSTALPLPVRRSSGFLGKAVINPEGAPDDEQAVGDVVSGAEGEFPDAGVDQEGADF